MSVKCMLYVQKQKTPQKQQQKKKGGRRVVSNGQIEKKTTEKIDNQRIVDEMDKASTWLFMCSLDSVIYCGMKYHLLWAPRNSVVI